MTPADRADAFHAHLDACKHCLDNPFDLCPEGVRLLLGVEGGACSLCRKVDESALMRWTVCLGESHWSNICESCFNTIVAAVGRAVEQIQRESSP